MVGFNSVVNETVSKPSGLRRTLAFLKGVDLTKRLLIDIHKFVQAQQDLAEIRQGQLPWLGMSGLLMRSCLLIDKGNF